MKFGSAALVLCAFVVVLQLVLSPASFAAEGAVTPEQGKALIDEKKDGIVILDVRTPAEHAEQHYDGSLNIAVEELEQRIAEVPADKPILIHCARGRRAARAINIIKEKRSDINDVQFIKGKPLF